MAMKRNLLLLLFISFTCNCLNAQFSRYIIKFKNKATNPYSISSPSTYLSAKAIARRTAYGIAIDSTDLPVTARYVDSVRLAGTVTILNVSKWLNQVSIQTTDAAALNKINNLTFVQTVTGIAARVNNGNNENPKTKDKFELERELIDAPLQRNTNTSSDFFSYGNTYDEIHLHNGEFLHNIGMRGQNMLVAVLDAGFFHYNTLKAFDSVVANNQVVQTWDFVARESSVTEDDSHGMSCFSAIGGNIPGSFVGNAPKANLCFTEPKM
jgi:serine protease AprX